MKLLANAIGETLEGGVDGVRIVGSVEGAGAVPDGVERGHCVVVYCEWWAVVVVVGLELVTIEALAPPLVICDLVFIGCCPFLEVSGDWEECLF